MKTFFEIAGWCILNTLGCTLFILLIWWLFHMNDQYLIKEDRLNLETHLWFQIAAYIVMPIVAIWATIVDQTTD